MNTPPTVSAQEWDAAREQLLAKEKELTRARDALAAERRRMPRMAVEKSYRFEGPDGDASLLDLFDGRRQLIVYRFFYEPGVKGWPEHGCPGCSFLADQVAHLAHLNARDTTLAFASRAPQPEIERWKARMGWDIPWYTITDDFDADFGVDEWHGTNAFIREDDRIFRTYFVNEPRRRGDGEHLELPRHHGPRAPGGVGGLARRLSADAAVPVVASPRRVPGSDCLSSDRMTRFLTRLADLAYRRRGRMVLAWIAAMVVIIGVGSSLAGEYNADYDTPGSESEAASELLDARFDGYSGQEVYVVWKADAGAAAPATRERLDDFFAEAEQVDNISEHGAIRVSEDGKIGSTTLPMTVPGWEVEKEDGEELIAAAEQHDGEGLEIKLGGDPIYVAQEQSSPEFIGFLGAAIVLLIAFGSVVAAGLPLGDSAGGTRHHLGRADRPARELRRRAGLDDRGVGPDRDRRRDRLRAAGADPLPLRAARRQGPPRRRGRGRHDRRPQHHHRRRDRGDLGARALPDRPRRTCTASRSRPPLPCSS